MTEHVDRSGTSLPSLHHILRIFVPRGCEDTKTAEIIAYADRTGCSEVLLFTSSYDTQPSFIDLSEVRADVARFEIIASRLRDAGIVFSVNVLQTLGHVYFPRDLDSAFPFQRRVYSDGSESMEGACPLCSGLREWVRETYGLYAGLKPGILFVDDDYRPFMQGLSCFCRRHLEQVSDVMGRPVTRSEIVAALRDTTWPADPVRHAFYEVTTKGLCDLAETIREAVHDVSTMTRVGLMVCRPPAGALGMDIARVAEALAGPHRALVRPQSGMYGEGLMRDMPHHFSEPDWLRAVLPSEVEHYPEIENYPYTGYGKSAQCTFVQMATQVLMGFDHLALNIFDVHGAPFADHETLIGLLQKRRGFLDALHDLIPEGTRPRGIEAFVHPGNPLNHRVSTRAGDQPVEWLDHKTIAGRLPCLGLPVTHAGPCPWLLLSGDDVLAATDEQIDNLLQRGAVMDAKAADALAIRGFAQRIGVRVGEPIPLDDLGFEAFIDAGINPSLHGRCFPLRALVRGGDWRRLEDLTGYGRPASVIRNFRGDDVGPAVLLSENASGERFAVLAFCGDGERGLIENQSRAEQMRQSFAWVARRPLPVTTRHQAPYLWPILNRAKDSRWVLGIVNLSTDSYTRLPLRFAPDLTSCRIHRLNDEGHMVDVDVEVKGAGCVTLRCGLAPMALAVFLLADAGGPYSGATLDERV